MYAEVGGRPRRALLYAAPIDKQFEIINSRSVQLNPVITAFIQRLTMNFAARFENSMFSKDLFTVNAGEILPCH